jgi:hypothetical protein
MQHEVLRIQYRTRIEGGLKLKIQVLINQANLKFDSSTEGHRLKHLGMRCGSCPSVWNKQNATLLFPHRLGKGTSLESIGAFSTATHSADDG